MNAEKKAMIGPFRIVAFEASSIGGGTKLVVTLVAERETILEYIDHYRTHDTAYIATKEGE